MEEIETENGVEKFLLIKLIHAKHTWLDKLFHFLTIDQIKSVKDFPAIKRIIKEHKPDMFSIKSLKDFDKSKKKYHLIKLFYKNDVYKHFNELNGEIKQKMNKKFKQISDYFKQFPNFEIETDKHFLFISYKLSKNLTICMTIEDDTNEAYFYSYSKENSSSTFMKLSYKASNVRETVYYNDYDEDYVKELKHEFDNIIKDINDELSEIYNKLIPEFIDEYEQMKGKNNA